MQTILPMLQSDGEIHLTFEYSDADGGSIDMHLTYAGTNLNPLEAGDKLSVTLARHACQTLNWQYQDGICRIDGTLA